MSSPALPQHLHRPAESVIMNTANTTWTTASSGYDTTTIGRYTVIVWTGSPAVDLDDGYQMCDVYIPTTDRDIPDGRMIVSSRRLETRDRMGGRLLAVQIAIEAIADYEAFR